MTPIRLRELLIRCEGEQFDAIESGSESRADFYTDLLTLINDELTKKENTDNVISSSPLHSNLS